MRPESLYFLFSPVTRLKGVGGATAQALERLLPAATVISGGSIPIIRDLLFHLPIGLVDRRFTCPLNAAPDGVVATFVVTVDSHRPPKRGSKQPYQVICSNDTGDVTLVFFHAHEDYLKQMLPVGQKRVISGCVERFDYRLQMPHPDIIAPVEKLAEIQKPEAVYPLTVGITSRRIAGIVDQALEKLPELPEWAPTHALSWKEALEQAHHPQTQEDLLPNAPARLRLAYDEILANQLHLAILRYKMERQPGEIIAGTGQFREALIAALPFVLTEGQQRVLAQIGEDMASGQRMARLLQGDVGCGKTIVALLSMLRAVEQGLQTALMAPTELIARQHYEVISSLLATCNLQPPTLLTGSVKGKTRERALADIASGDAKIIIGTQALFQESVHFHRLALIVIDEQHRFGVGQRMALSSKGKAPHILHMTATPIPRSLTMTLYGDMDCSLLREKPAGRQPIATRIIPLSRYQEVLERLQAALDKGEKAYWICPFIEGPTALEESDIAAAKSRFAEFKAKFGNRIGLIHGSMNAEERDQQMQRFAKGETQLLVATTVVEVGVDVKDATIIVIEQAERFGLSQLHQLRGRVGRGNKPSACVLLYNDRLQASALGEASAATALSRLSILRETEDGFRIAEEDLKLRGGGDLLGTRQSGMPRFIFTDLFRHHQLLERAREDAKKILAEDPDLTSPRGQALRIALQLFGFEVAD